MLAACSGPYSTLDPAGPSAAEAAWLWWGMFIWFTIVLIGVVALWGFAMFRTPKQPVTESQARQIQTRWIIGGGIILPVASIVVILVFGIPAGHRMQTLGAEYGADLLQINVTGHQWWWEVHYPDTGITLTDELHIPASVPVAIHLTTSDVIHSFWVPRLAGKLDAIPGRVNILRLQADKPGTYGGQCAEFCGLDHAHMKFTVTAHTQEDFNLWLEEAQDD